MNGDSAEPWRIAREGTDHFLPPYGWLAVQREDFFESSELVDGERCDRVGSPAYVFLDGRGRPRSFAGVAASGSAAVRSGEGGRGLSIIAIEGVEEISITSPGGSYRPGDVRSRIARLAAAERVAALAYDLEGKLLGEAPVSRIPSGWKIADREGAARYELLVE